ncbi:MAG: hypothetical protein AB7O67_01985 [Vicinamibacterales bacterium]
MTWRQFGLPAEDAGEQPPRAHDVWVEVELGEGWRAAYRIVPSSPFGEPAIGELRVFPSEGHAPTRPPGEWSAELLGTRARCPRGGVTAKVLKSIRLRSVIPELNAVMSVSVSPSAPDSPSRPRSAALSPSAALTEAGRQSLARRRADLARFEEAYAPFKVRQHESARHSKPGRSGRPPVHSERFYAQVAQTYRAALDRGEPKAANWVATQLGLNSADTVRMMVHRGAKARGLITSFERSWILTDRAHELLKSDTRKAPARRRRGR